MGKKNWTHIEIEEKCASQPVQDSTQTMRLRGIQNVARWTCFLVRVLLCQMQKYFSLK